MRVGYLRVSSTDQNTVRQLDGIDVARIFEDKVSGVEFSVRWRRSVIA